MSVLLVADEVRQFMKHQRKLKHIYLLSRLVWKVMLTSYCFKHWIVGHFPFITISLT